MPKGDISKRSEGEIRNTGHPYEHLRPRKPEEIMRDRLSTMMQVDTSEAVQDQQDYSQKKISVNSIRKEHINTSTTALFDEYNKLGDEIALKFDMKQKMEYIKIRETCHAALQELYTFELDFEQNMDKNQQAVQSSWDMLEKKTDNPYLSKGVAIIKKAVIHEMKTDE